MALARYVVDAVVLEGRGVREVARAHRVSTTWVSVQLARYREGGYKALGPRSRRAVAGTHFRVRTDKADSCGKVTLRHDSKFFHIGMGRQWKGTPIRLYVADLDIRIMTFDGKLLWQLTLDPTRRYQPSGLPRYRVREGSDVP